MQDVESDGEYSDEFDDDEDDKYSEEDFEEEDSPSPVAVEPEPQKKDLDLAPEVEPEPQQPEEPSQNTTKDVPDNLAQRILSRKTDQSIPLATALEQPHLELERHYYQCLPETGAPPERLRIALEQGENLSHVARF